MKLKLSKGMVIFICIIAAIIFIAVFASYIVPHDPEKVDIKNKLRGPSINYPFGTDQLGRCIFSRVVYGARISFLVSSIVVVLSGTIGVGLGLMAGFYRGRIEAVIMRTVDVFLAFPGTLLALAIVGIFGGGSINLIIALTIVEWTGYTRIIRGSVVSVREQDYIKAVKGLGFRDSYTIVRHILPNILSPILVITTMSMGGLILSIAGLSFLGIGIQPPTPEWGFMISDAKFYLRDYPHIMLFPGLAIIVTAMSFNYIGEGLRDMLDPTLNKEL